MNKKQFLLLTILAFISIITINVCLGILLPRETTLQEVMHIILSLSSGTLLGVIIGFIMIVFENTRKDK